MSKFVIWVSGRPNLYGFTRREFIWNEPLQLFIYKNKVFGEDEFNALVEEALLRYMDDHPRVKVVEFEPAPPAAADREITVSEAEEVMQRLAPHRLKKKPGPHVEDLDHAVAS